VRDMDRTQSAKDTMSELEEIRGLVATEFDACEASRKRTRIGF
jgi:hypothetical protein